jgi:prevent-host-death family protein
LQTVPIYQAKDRFSALLQAVEEGEEIVITRHGKKIARIVKETDVEQSEAELERIRKEAVAELKAFQSKVKPAVKGHSDWKSLRDAGRKY